MVFFFFIISISVKPDEENYLMRNTLIKDYRMKQKVTLILDCKLKIICKIKHCILITN